MNCNSFFVGGRHPFLEGQNRTLFYRGGGGRRLKTVSGKVWPAVISENGKKNLQFADIAKIFFIPGNQDHAAYDASCRYDRIRKGYFILEKIDENVGIV